MSEAVTINTRNFMILIILIIGTFTFVVVANVYKEGPTSQTRNVTIENGTIYENNIGNMFENSELTISNLPQSQNGEIFLLIVLDRFYSGKIDFPFELNTSKMYEDIILIEDGSAIYKFKAETNYIIFLYLINEDAFTENTIAIDLIIQPSPLRDHNVYGLFIFIILVTWTFVFLGSIRELIIIRKSIMREKWKESREKIPIDHGENELDNLFGRTPSQKSDDLYPAKSEKTPQASTIMDKIHSPKSTWKHRAPPITDENDTSNQLPPIIKKKIGSDLGDDKHELFIEQYYLKRLHRMFKITFISLITGVLSLVSAIRYNRSLPFLLGVSMISFIIFFWSISQINKKTKKGDENFKRIDFKAM